MNMNTFETFFFFSKIIITTPIVPIHNMVGFSFSFVRIRTWCCGRVRVGVVNAMDKAWRNLHG